MADEVHGFGLYGMYGPITDPGEHQFSNRVRDELGVNIHGSPYRDYDVNAIIDEIMKLPEDATLLVWGTSLGANNAPIVGQYLAARSKRLIHGLFGFQASSWGAHSVVTSNVLFAHLFYSFLPINFGLGAYVWPKAPGNHRTSLYTDRRDLLHPGDGDPHSQDVFLTEMKRIIAKPE